MKYLAYAMLTPLIACVLMSFGDVGKLDNKSGLLVFIIYSFFIYGLFLLFG